MSRLGHLDSSARRRISGTSVRHVGRYAAVGAASFALDLCLLVILREALDVPLSIATTIAFWSALAFNFSAQRRFTFEVQGDIRDHLARYSVLLVVNYVATVGIVVSAQRIGVGYAAGKVIAAGVLTITTYVAYRRWVFRAEDA